MWHVDHLRLAATVYAVLTMGVVGVLIWRLGLGHWLIGG